MKKFSLPLMGMSFILVALMPWIQFYSNSSIHFLALASVTTFTIFTFGLAFRAHLKQHRLVNNKVTAFGNRVNRVAKEANKFIIQRIFELRRPLQGLNGIQDIYTRNSDSKVNEEYFQIADYCSRFIERRLARLQLFTEFESEKYKKEPVDFSLKHCIESAIKTSSEQVGNRTAVVVDEFQGNVPEWVTGHEPLLHKMLVELIDNAIRYGGSSRVAVRIAVDPNNKNNILFTVSDSGPGLSEYYLRYLVDTNNNHSNIAVWKATQNGFGLVLFKKLLKILNGKLEVSSRKGIGSSITFSLGESALSPAIQVHQSVAHGYSDKEITALVVDDESITRQIVSNFLKKLGINTVHAENGQEALVACRERIFDLVFMDINMPILNGFEATSAIMKQKDIRHKPEIVFLSAQSTEEDKQRARELGVRNFLAKPVRLDEVRKLMLKLNMLPRPEQSTDETFHISRASEQIITKPMKLIVTKKAKSDAKNQMSGYYIDYNKLFNSLDENSTLCNDLLEQVAVDLEICLENMAVALTHKNMKQLSDTLSKAEGELSMILCPLGVEAVKAMQLSLRDGDELKLQVNFENISDIFEDIISEISQLTTNEQIVA